ncbi:hypothetical protein YC2023_051612 [Brassica napus]
MVGTLLFIDDLLSFYNGIPLRYCLDNESDLKTYPDISQAASDTSRRIFVSGPSNKEVTGNTVVAQNHSLVFLAHINTRRRCFQTTSPHNE